MNTNESVPPSQSITTASGARRREPEPEKVPIGISMSDLTMDQFMDIEDEPGRFERV
jgi:hypothetical protein